MITLEFLGMSRTGKTSQSRAISKWLESLDKKVILVDRTAIGELSGNNLKEMHTFIVKRLIDIYEKCYNRADFLIYDRGFYDRQAMLSWDFQNKRIQDEFMIRMMQILSEKTKLVDKAFLFMVNPENSLKRIKYQRREELDYSHLSKEVIQDDEIGTIRQLQEVYNQLKEMHPSMHIIDGNAPIEQVTLKIKKELEIKMYMEIEGGRKRYYV